MRWLILAFAVGTFVSSSYAGAAELRAGDLTLTLDEQLVVRGLRVGGQILPVTPAPLVTLWASDTAQTATPTVLGGGLSDGLRLRFAEARAEGTLQIVPRGELLNFRCVITGEEGPDRGFLLRVVFPVEAIGWRWHEDIQTAVPIVAGKIYENVQPLRAYADLPEWRDRPALRMGYLNRNFCTTISGPVGLALAVPLDQPRLFRTAYDANNRRLEIVYEFALSGLTRVPYTAEFAFDLYACDPAWGMRSALEKYYAAYPALFRVYAPRQGQWMAFNRLSEIDNANEFGFGLQEGAPEPQYDDQLGVLSTIYYTHAGMPANLPPPYDPERDPLPPYEEQVKAVNEAFRRQMGQEGIYDIVGTRKPDGKLAVEKWQVYAHLIAQFNLDPELPWGKFLLDGTIKRTEEIKQRTGGDLDGFYYDGLTSGLNYNREHFRTADTPPLWDPERKQAFLYNFFSSIEFARATAELLRPRGQITMMNGGLDESFFVVPWLDFLGAETGLIIPRAGFNYVRTSLYHKPFLTLLKGNYEQKIGRSEVELFMKRCLAYGVFPGFFDWPPSGLGPGGRYWDHARYYERDRDLHRRYQPLCRALALAGWEPVTHARNSNANLFVERFGQRDLVWLTLLNESAEPQKTALTVEAAALGLDPKNLRATEILTGQTLRPQFTGGRLVFDLAVPGNEVWLLQLGSPEAVARWHLQQAAETLEAGQIQRRVDAHKPPLLVHWRAQGAGYEREYVDGRPVVVFRADGQKSRGLQQWAMLFQPVPTPLRVQLRLRAHNFEDKGDARLRCRLAWVTPSYTHYEMKEFPLPGGTYEWRDLEYEITSAQALRAIELLPTIGARATGELQLAQLFLRDASGRDYVVDPEFSQWYEPFPEALRQPIESRIEGLRKRLIALAAQTGSRRQPAFRQSLAQCFAEGRQIEELIRKARAENGCRRVLRDLETMRNHLSAVTLAAYDLASPRIEGPSAAAPGDIVTLQLVAPPARGGLPPLRTEWRSDLKIAAQGTRASLTIPPTAQLGDRFVVKGLLHLGRPGEEATLEATQEIRVVAPLALTLQSGGFEATTGAARIRAIVRNNHLRPVEAELTLAAPPEWKRPAPQRLRLPAAAEQLVELTLLPEGKGVAGPIEVVGQLAVGSETAQANLWLLCIPPEANRVPNPGFEEGLQPWAAAPSENIFLDMRVVRSGQRALCLYNPTRRDTQASVSVTLNQTRPTPILVQACSRAENVDGPPNTGYSLYVDIYYTDGTPWYGSTFNFATGTTDWQLGELYLEPAKPIRNVNIYLLLRGKAGKAWFDDIAMMEDPRRRGNLAREAKIAVDSNYTGYDPSPINDGVIRGEGLHWTKEAWASAENDQPHFVELQFPQPVSLQRLLIYWSLDAGVPRTSQEVHWQIWEDGRWRTLASAKGLTATPQTELRLPAPTTGTRFRLWQPPHSGPAQREGLMWIREIEAFAE